MPREPYLCVSCETNEAFGSRYLVSDEKRGKFNKCMGCAMKERDQASEEFEKTLLPEQKELYDKYVAAESMVSSIFILD